ncbi:uncharacterized protein SPPG_04817 [Spizellomyces punctatus DAOM BR117]|uniref:TLC domain-containing protein n=1 Tax=Spizellomyces punctatus (strain DAOM BR117) TaxID=645134 RepID=A0A0L0HHE9_SPIPD|nr:hypothetical protein, variant 2 [Spizellomyces punctatus DAOM BR117]XP_016608542.1 hypothetical protein, variant 1 [Spizellomyces punctatus DAOM BR117]XP_016608543.1 uncharacterized protein SPPG_04817 [Spizellomyces punctatus DAOM BR117]KND00502.1 hypothetical protein, variant 2 [Spizellomyces punctatus DAOM BR117]KND00503.1 hypothetical protein, variant 1 [Spizellomyces punctatus DAOM BR117]KND00504.1 hypothetical protein SPPG_04817 [Spizellomyces punctatus DAOM BR117]|eukprot:XP_016608541.1 hypothetical protein, variant 2 [Spizellomyces punctatus DAOM BR117]
MQSTTATTSLPLPFSLPFSFYPITNYLPTIPLPKFLIKAENPDIRLPEDLLDFLWFAIGWAILHAVLLKYVFEPLARYLVPPPNAPTKADPKVADAIEGCSSSTTSKSAPKIRARKGANGISATHPHKKAPRELARLPPVDDRTKFSLSAWKLVTYGASTVTGLYILFSEDWMLTPDMYWEQVGQPGRMSDLVKFYYKLGFSSYLYHSVTIFFEPKQKDFPVMVTHHLVTLILMFLSYVWPYYRVGCAILLLHDCSDPIMEAAKMALYSGKTRAADALFAAFAAVFIWTRNWIFPVYVIRSCYDWSFKDNTSLITPATAATAFLILLEAFHLYWASLILKMAKKAILDKGVSDDTRNH